MKTIISKLTWCSFRLRQIQINPRKSAHCDEITIYTQALEVLYFLSRPFLNMTCYSPWWLLRYKPWLWVQVLVLMSITPFDCTDHSNIVAISFFENTHQWERTKFTSDRTYVFEKTIVLNLFGLSCTSVVQGGSAPLFGLGTDVVNKFFSIFNENNRSTLCHILVSKHRGGWSGGLFGLLRSWQHQVVEDWDPKNWATSVLQIPSRSLFFGTCYCYSF